MKMVGVLTALVGASAETCSFPPSAGGAGEQHLTHSPQPQSPTLNPAASRAAELNVSLTCMPGTLNPLTATTTASIDGGGASPSLYVDAKATVYDMAPVASFVDSPTGRVKAAVIPRNTDTKSLAAMLKTAKDDGAEIALITEEDFGASRNNGEGEGLSGPHVTAVAAAAKALEIYVVCSFRMQLSAGESYNGAVVIGRNGTILKAAHSGYDHYEKVFPVLGWPLGPLSEGFPGGGAETYSTQAGEIPVIPGQKGVQVWDLPGIGRVAILICFGKKRQRPSAFSLCCSIMTTTCVASQISTTTSCGTLPTPWARRYATRHPFAKSLDHPMLHAREQVVFWPSMMTTPDRDAISLSRLFRFHIVANGSPGAIHDNTGHMGAQTSQVHRCSWWWV